MTHQARTFLQFLMHLKSFFISHPFIWIMCIASLLLSAALIPLVIKLCNKYHWYDTVDARKVHTGNIPRLGSVGFVTAFSVASIVYSLIDKDAHLSTLLPFVVAGFIIFLFGVIDDFLNLKAKYKLAVQIVAAVIIVLSGYRFKNIGSIVFPLWFSYCLTFCWIIGIINAFNLIDGVDGLCGGLSSLIILTLAVIYSSSAVHSSAICFILVFAIFGFLIYNNPHPKAKIFMGDGGSQFLGFMISSLPLYQSTANFEYNKLFIMIDLVSIPMMDVFAAIWRRLRDNRSIMSPDRLHLHHKLMNLGLSSKQVLFVLLFVQSCLCIVSGIAMYYRGFEGFVILGSAFVVMVILFSIVHYANRAVLKKKSSVEQPATTTTTTTESSTPNI
jgi:UDP-GlcNAc:undecaprenyl-phosphate GlcNAc-1-phosphate transferase